MKIELDIEEYRNLLLDSLYLDMLKVCSPIDLSSVYEITHTSFNGLPIMSQEDLVEEYNLKVIKG